MLSKGISALVGKGSTDRVMQRRNAGMAVPSGRTILAVDDDATAREAIRDVLSREGFTVHTASSYQSWEEAWRSGPTPDLVILDVILAERRGGYEILRAVRRQDQSVPVLMISARNTASDSAFATANGASAFISKGDGEFLHPTRGLAATVRRLLAS